MLRGVKGSMKIKDMKMIYEAASIESYKNIRASLPKIENAARSKVSSIILTSLQRSDTVQSLLSGSLRDDFGLFGNTVQITVNNIVKYIANNFTLIISQAKKNRAAYTISVRLLKPGDIETIIGLPLGSFPSKGGMVDWLEWLTTKGSQVVLGDYFIYPYAKGNTRSGGTSIMQKIVSSGKAFRVDPKYAGTINDNFIRNAVLDVEDEIINEIALEIQRSA